MASSSARHSSASLRVRHAAARYVFDGTALGEVGGTSIEAPVLDEMAGWAIAASGARWVTSAPGYVVGDGRARRSRVLVRSD